MCQVSPWAPLRPQGSPRRLWEDMWKPSGSLLVPFPALCPLQKSCSPAAPFGHWLWAVAFAHRSGSWADSFRCTSQFGSHRAELLCVGVKVVACARQPVIAGGSPAPLSVGCSSRRAITPGLSPTNLEPVVWGGPSCPVVRPCLLPRDWEARCALCSSGSDADGRVFLFLPKFAMTSQTVACQGV